ncbi:MAG: tRNA uridine-5-carboxymethylaminomethyl(34) synthesis GTPase MnmE [Chthoniobacterales bacterium]
MFDDQTIAAISTPPGEGALAVVRVSGPSAFRIAAQIFSKPLQNGRVQVGRILDDRGGTVDEVVVTSFCGPRSYTGEDVVEISGHGGPVVAAAVLKTVLDAGARAAGPGEFTQRAFLNGKLDLTQAEAVMDLIRAQTPLAARAAALQLEGRIGNEARWIADGILSVVAHLEAYIDFPDEDISPEVGASMLANLAAIQARAEALLATAPEGRILREGVLLTLCGRPNAGKSSLLNRLAGFERAIVSPIAGTTRDTIEELVNLKGIPFRIVDTAGLRETDDAIEVEGVCRAKRAIDSADVVIRVVDSTQPDSEVPVRDDEILVLNKSDISNPNQESEPRDAVRISCLTGDGMDVLVERILHHVRDGHPVSEESHAAINARHQACLQRVVVALDAAITALRDALAPEFIAVELRLALEAAGEITGRMDTEDILDRIFGTFCIGK